MPLANKLWLIRHGETEWSRSGAHTGRTDLPLTPAGEAKATAIGRYLRGMKFALVLTSPLQRARETCRLAGYGDIAQLEPDLMEWSYGAYEGRTSAEIRQEIPGWNIWINGVASGETVEQVGARARRVIERASTAEGDAALFAHGHVLRILTACWLGLEPAAGRLFAFETACLSVLGYEREIRVIERWNESPEERDAA
ncbi:MAG TPA: histidine phosphatase family protein [Bryobacteraceae bacterium]|nr:histidine phosphatase family protein [Bryobacteraceae bacterium]